VDFTLGSDAAGTSANGDLELAAWAVGSTGAAERWRNDIIPFWPAAPDLDFSDTETEWKVRPSGNRAGVLSSDDFLWLWTRNVGNANGWPRQAWHLPATFTKRALQAAVMTNGSALVALAFMMQSVEIDAGMPAAIVLGLGLMFAGISTVLAYLNFQLTGASWCARAIQTTFWLATLSCAGSYAALAVAASWLLPVAI
jgi:hypothetical protein